MIRGIHEHLFAVLRDILFTSHEFDGASGVNATTLSAITDFVFHILRNANVLQRAHDPNMVVCWGGHSISRTEYDYSKQVGYELGLRALDICTGCGPGAMKGPMKGATIGHAKQRIANGCYLGILEPGIIAAELMIRWRLPTRRRLVLRQYGRIARRRQMRIISTGN